MVRSSLALAAVLSVASISLAGDLVTPPVFVSGTIAAACNLANITSTSLMIKDVQMISGDGTVLSTSGTFSLPPGVVGHFLLAGPNSTVYCRFVQVSKSKVRADLTSTTSSDGSNNFVVPAQ
jgi:hypothetical protein